MIYKERLKNLRKLLSERKLSAVVIFSRTSEFTTLPNIYYYTGFAGVWPCALLVTKDDAIFYSKEPEALKGSAVPVETDGLKERVAKGKVGIDGLAPFSFYKSIGNVAAFADISKELTQLRAIKDSYELKQIHQASRFTDKMFVEVERALKTHSEAAVSRAINLFRVENDLSPAYDNIVAGDKNGVDIHYMANNKRFSKTLMVDAAVQWKHYKSDVTRTFVLDRKNKEIARAYTALTELQGIFDDVVKPGLKVADLCKLSIDFLTKNGYAKSHFGNFHSLGHGVGLDIHESPTLATKSSDTLQEGMVFTLEPGIYMKGKFGIRLEDTCVMTKNGFKRLTKFPF